MQSRHPQADEAIVCRLSNGCHAVAEAKVKHLSAIDSFLLSLNHFLKLRTKHVHLSADQIAAKRNVKPVSLLAFNNEFVRIGNISGAWHVAPGLRDHIDEQIPSPRLYLSLKAPARSLLAPFLFLRPERSLLSRLRPQPPR